MVKFFFVLTLLLGLMGCKTMPEPKKSDMFTVISAGFNLNTGDPNDAEFIIKLALNKLINKKFYLEAVFDDSCNSGGKIIKSDYLFPNQNAINFRVSYPCLKAGEYYTVKITTYDSIVKNEIIDELEQKAYCSMDSQGLRGAFQFKK